MRNREIGCDPGSNPGRAILKMRNGYDFSIDDSKPRLLQIIDGVSEERIYLDIPEKRGACYLSVVTVEDDDKFKGKVNDIDKQKILYYDKKGRIVGIQNLNAHIKSRNLMMRLEREFERLC